jgi:MYXO-CTERM domain-containing protein
MLKFGSRVALLLLLALPASATTLGLSQEVSEPTLDYLGTPLVELLDATVSFDVVTLADASCNFADCLKITLTNDTDSNSPTFWADITELAFSTSSNVTTLNPDILPANWDFNVSTGNGGLTHLDGFGIHDYSLTTPQGGMNSGALMPAQTLIFSFETNAGLTMDDFVQFSEMPGPGDQITTLATAKFIRFRNGPDTELDLLDLCAPTGCDSAFGGVVTPEPSSGLMYGLGLLGLLYAGRRRRG